MLIFIHGKDNYRSKQKLKEIIEEYKKKHKSGLNLRFFDKKTRFQDFKDQINQSSMFSEKKLAIIKEAFSNKSFKEGFLEEGSNWVDSDSVIVFYEPDKVSKKDPLFKLLKDKAKCQEFKPLKGKKLRSFVKEQFKKYSCNIDNKALSLFINFVGSDLWRASNEVKKLAAFKEEVKEKDIRELVKPKIETDIFKAIDALIDRDKKKALTLINAHLKEGDSPLYLLHMINYQARNLLVVKDLSQKGLSYNNMRKKANLHPFVFKKSFNQSKRFKLGEIKKIYHKIFRADLDIKTGKEEPEAALEKLVAEL